MLLDKLENLDYDFNSLPDEVQQSIDFMTEMRMKTQGTSDQKIAVLDFAIFRLIEQIDRSSEIVQAVRSEYELDKKTDSNNGFNSKGLVDLSAEEIRIVENNDNLMDLSDNSGD